MRGTFALVALLAGLASGPSLAGPTPPAATAPAKAEVTLRAAGGGLFVPVMINDAVRLDFVLDSGASMVSIPADVAMTLMRTGTITRADFLGNQTFQLADGSTVPSTILRIRSLKVGDLELHDVEASVSDVKGPLLLGETFLTRLSSWTVDNQRHVLAMGPEIPGSAPVLTARRPTRSRHPSHADDATSDQALPPQVRPAAPAPDLGSPRAATGAEWDADFYQACVATGGVATPAYCHCIGTQLQPLLLSRKNRLRPHSHALKAAIAQCVKLLVGPSAEP
jgi:aspartyl protease family protein